jgi:translation initiation factor eIF-2B subunit alpha
MDGLAMEYRAYANENPALAAATVAIKILTSVIERSKATTMMGLEKEIKEAAAVLRRCVLSCLSYPAGYFCLFK